MKWLAIAISGFLLMFSGCCAPCGPCGGPVCGPPPLFPHLVNRMRCASGCGDFYLGEWHADPPSCDPCNHCGEYIGPVCGCKPTLRELWGIRYDACCDTGCSSCGHGHPGHGPHDQWVEDEIWHDDQYYTAPVVPRGIVEEIRPREAVGPTPAAEPPMPEASDSTAPQEPMANPPMDDPPMSDPGLPEPAAPAQPLDGGAAPFAPMQTMRGTYSNQSPFARSHRPRR